MNRSFGSSGYFVQSIKTFMVPLRSALRVLHELSAGGAVIRKTGRIGSRLLWSTRLISCVHCAAKFLHRRVAGRGDAMPAQHLHCGHCKDFQVEQEGAIVHVPYVESQLLIPRDGVATVDLGPACDTWPNLMTASLFWCVAIDRPLAAAGDRPGSCRRSRRSITAATRPSLAGERSCRRRSVGRRRARVVRLGRRARAWFETCRGNTAGHGVRGGPAEKARGTRDRLSARPR